MRCFVNFFEESSRIGDFPGGPVVKNPPSNAEDTGSVSGQGTKIPHVAGRLSPQSTTRVNLPHSNETFDLLRLRADAAK